MVLALAAHILKLEWYREDEHGLCTRMTSKFIQCSIKKDKCGIGKPEFHVQQKRRKNFSNEGLCDRWAKYELWPHPLQTWPRFGIIFGSPHKATVMPDRAWVSDLALMLLTSAEGLYNRKQRHTLTLGLSSWYH